MTQNHMTDRPPSKVPLMLADVVESVSKDARIPEGRRKALLTSFRCFAQRLQIDLEIAPAEVEHVRMLFRRLDPARVGISPSRASNIKSHIRSALYHGGIIRIPGRLKVGLSPAWLRQLSMLPDKYRRAGLSRFAGYCSTEGIEPADVNNEVADAYLIALTKESLAAEPERAHRQTLVSWNRATKEFPEWPQVSLTIPDRRETWTIPWEDFPTSFTVDVDAYIKDMRGENLASENAPIRPWAPETARTNRYKLQVYASALVSVGKDSASFTSIRDLIEDERLVSAFHWMLDHFRERATVYSIAICLKTVARRWLEVDASQLNQLNTVCRNLNPRKQGLNDRVRAQLRPLRDQVNVAKLISFPLEQMERLRRSDSGGRDAAIDAQIAVAVEILLMTALRRGNLAAIDIERHLHWSRGIREGTLHLVIPAEEVKNRQSLEFELSFQPVDLLLH